MRVEVDTRVIVSLKYQSHTGEGGTSFGELNEVVIGLAFKSMSSNLEAVERVSFQNHRKSNHRCRHRAGSKVVAWTRTALSTPPGQ